MNRDKLKTEVPPGVHSYPIIQYLEGLIDGQLVDGPSGSIVFTINNPHGCEFRVLTPPKVDILRGDSDGVDQAVSKLSRGGSGS